MRLLLYLMLAFPLSSIAQKYALLEGNLDPLKGQTTISTEIAFDNIIIGSNIKEDKFVADKKIVWDIEGPDKGDAWAKMWFDGQQKYYNPAFRKTLSKYLPITTTDNAPYTIILKTIQIEPGWNGGVIGGVAWVDVQAWIVDSSDRSKVIAKIKLPICKGKDSHGGDFQMSERILQAYGTAGHLLALFIRKNTRK